MSFWNSLKLFTFDEHSNSISAPSQIRTRYAPFLETSKLTTRQQHIKKLLTKFHLNTLERKEFITNPIRLTEIRECIQHDMQNNNIFPDFSADIYSVFEGHFIEKINDREFKLHWQRHHSTNPFQIAEKKQEKYSDFENVVRNYIDKEYHFNIDGLTIIK